MDELFAPFVNFWASVVQGVRTCWETSPFIIIGLLALFWVPVMVVLPQPWFSLGLIMSGGVSGGVLFVRHRRWVRHNRYELCVATIRQLEAELRPWEEWDVSMELARRERQSAYMQRIMDGMRLMTNAGKVSLSSADEELQKKINRLIYTE